MRTLITAKIHPDLDGLACSYAYAKYFSDPSYIGGVFGNPHPEAQYLIDRFSINDISYNPNGPFERFILVDASHTLGMPEMIVPEEVVEVIDHRDEPDVEKLFPNAKIQNELIGAAATIITERFYEKDSIDFNSAVLLYGAIYSNTLNFNGTNIDQLLINVTIRPRVG